MKKGKGKLIKNYILLFLILVLVALLVIPIDWIANHIPDGIVGLLIFIGYILFICVLFAFSIKKVGSKLYAAEQEKKI